MWIEYHQELRDHWKIARLASTFSVPYAQALGWISCLWLWASTNAEDGSLKRFTDQELASAARAENVHPEAFTIALVTCELIDRDRTIHAWKEYGIKYLLSARLRKAKWKKKSTLPERSKNVTGTATVPNRTIPNRSTKEKRPADAGSSSAQPVETPLLTAEFKKIAAEGLNLYALLGQLRKELKWSPSRRFPEEVLLAVCASYWHQKPAVREAWPWFVKVVTQEVGLWSAAQHVKEADGFKSKGPLSLGEILARAQASVHHEAPSAVHTRT